MKRKSTYILIIMFLFTQLAYADNPQVRVAIIDTGISHETIDVASLIPGFNYLTKSQETNDFIGHGTGVTGIIRAIAPDVKLVPLVIATRTEDGKRVTADCDTLAQAISDAIDIYDCKVINLSAGSLLNKESLQEAVAYAEEKGVLLISSVGNDYLSFPDNIYYPAAYETVLGVSSLKRNGKVSSFAQRNDSVSICAPGEGLKLVSLRKGTTTFGFGTSYATSYVSGVAALLVTKYPNLTPGQIRQIINESADDLGEEGYDIDSGWGALNMNNIMAYIENGLFVLQNNP